MKTLDINQALRVYLGSDANDGVRPYDMRERVQNRYGADAEWVQARIDEALEGLLQLDAPDLHKLHTLQAIATFAEERARSRRPELDLDVCRAIGSYVAWGYQ